MTLVRHLVIVGTGLIAGSVARGLKSRGAVGRVTGIDANADTAHRAQALGVVDAVAPDLAEVAPDADLIVLGVPTRSVAGVLGQLAAVPDLGAVITDTASVKLPVVAAARRCLGAAAGRFVAGHPVAGSERSGPEAAEVDLFTGRRVILSPEDNTDPAALALVESMWRTLGALPERLDAADHDRLLAQSSHLPHALAFVLVDALAARSDVDAVLRYAAGGFRDFTRIAASDPVMWRDIFVDNAAEVAPGLREMAARLTELAACVEAGDATAIEALCQRARALRRQFEVAGDS